MDNKLNLQLIVTESETMSLKQNCGILQMWKMFGQIS